MAVKLPERLREGKNEGQAYPETRRSWPPPPVAALIFAVFSLIPDGRGEGNMKMKRRAVWMFAAVVSVAARAQVAEGENLLMNAGFEVEQPRQPDDPRTRTGPGVLSSVRHRPSAASGRCARGDPGVAFADLASNLIMFPCGHAMTPFVVLRMCNSSSHYGDRVRPYTWVRQ
jgi:hypothetical protein